MSQGANNMNSNDEFIYNWTNSLRQTADGATFVATRLASDLKDKGYNASEASDMLLGQEYNLSLVDKVVNTVFAEKTAQLEEKPIVAYVVPTAYEDIKPFVEKTLKCCSGREFMEKLAKTQYPIMTGLNTHSYESFVRLASEAKKSEYALQKLHQELLPFLETAMFSCVSSAETNRPRTVVSENKDGTHRVLFAGKIESEIMSKTMDVDANNVTLKTSYCNCDKFERGNYADFGLACEHIIAAADEVSPNYKLQRDCVD
jgi:hypothetical protein